MKLKTIAILAMAVLVCTDASALSRKKKKQDKPVAEKIQPVDGAHFSYAMGVAQSSSLIQYLQGREGIDSLHIADAAKGIAAYATMSEAKVKELTAFVAGLRIGEMNQKQIIPSLNKQATGKTDTTYADIHLFNKGLCEGMMGTNTLSADSAMKVAEQQMKYFTSQLKETNLAWLAANKKTKGVKTTKSGLQYRVLSEGKGAVAADTTEVEVHYEGKLIDGTVFDSSYKRNQPATFRPNQVIKGWTEALQMMPEGSVWELYIPYDLAYGERGNQNIPPFATLIFKVEVLKVKGAANK